MNVISASYGNDSIALIRWAYENQLDDVHVVYVDTGWAHPSWESRIAAGRTLSFTYGFDVHHIKGDFDFESMVRMKKGFPSQRYQFCSGILKGLPFIEWSSEYKDATIFIGKRREESHNRKDTPLWDFNNKFYPDNDVCYPLYKHTETMRNKLVEKTGLPVLPHRSMECCPCVNASKGDFLMIPPDRVEKIRQLEKETGQTMFRPYRHMGATGIDEVIKWARSSRGSYCKGQLFLWEEGQCVTGLCGM